MKTQLVLAILITMVILIGGATASSTVSAAAQEGNTTLAKESTKNITSMINNMLNISEQQYRNSSNQ